MQWFQGGGGPLALSPPPLTLKPQLGLHVVALPLADHPLPGTTREEGEEDRVRYGRCDRRVRGSCPHVSGLPMALVLIVINVNYISTDRHVYSQ